MNAIFKWVYEFLKWISKITGFTYREINIIVYFIIIPSLFCYLLSRIYKKKQIVIGFILFIIVGLLFIPDFESFSNDLFDASVVFLNWFDVIGLNYIEASVVICVFVPVLIMIGLSLIYKKKRLKS